MLKAKFFHVLAHFYYLFRKPLFKPYYARRLISDTSSSNQVVSPEVESAASSLLEMSSNAAARIQLKCTTSSGNPSIPVCSSTNCDDTSVKPTSGDTKTESDSVDRIQPDSALTWTQSTTATVKPQSISFSAMEQLFLNSAKTQCRSAATTADSAGDNIEVVTTTVTPQYANRHSVRKEMSSNDVNMMKSKSDQIHCTGDTNNSAQDQSNQLPASCNISFSAESSTMRYSVSPYRPQTVQNYCQNLYQGVNLYQNTVPPQIQGQQFSFIQPFIQQQFPSVPYQLPYIPYQNGYQPSVMSQTPTWTYIPVTENQYPINLSLRNQTSVQPPKSESVQLMKSSVGFNQNKIEPGLSNGQMFSREQTQKAPVFSLTKKNTKSHSELISDASKKVGDNPQEDKKPDVMTSIRKNSTSQPIKERTAADSARGKPQVKSDLQALSDLTLGVGQSNANRSKESKAFLVGAGTNDTDLLHRKNPDNKIPTSNVLKDVPLPNWDKTSHLFADQNSSAIISPLTVETDYCLNTLNQVSNRSGETIYIDRNRKRLSLTSFPYSQAIKLPDRHMSLIKLTGDHVSTKNIARMQEISCAQDSVDARPGNTTSNNVVDVHRCPGGGTTVKELLQMQNLSSKISYLPEQTTGTERLQGAGNPKKEFAPNSDDQGQYENKLKTPAGNVLKQEKHKKVDSYFIKDEHNGITEKTPQCSSNITVEISHGGRLIADTNGSWLQRAKQRSMSDSNYASVTNYENLGSVTKTATNLSMRNLNSKGELQTEIVENPNIQLTEKSETKPTNDMVHVVGSNKVVTVKVSKYPEINTQSKATDKIVPTCKHVLLNPISDPAGHARKDVSKWKQNPLNIKIGKAPIIRSRPPQESSSLSIEERQYLEQIQHYPRNQYHNSSLAQLLMKDFKIIGSSPSRMSVNNSTSSRSEAKVLPEQFLISHCSQNSPPKRTMSDSELLHQNTSSMDESASGLGNKNKSTNTPQDDVDDNVFVEDLSFPQSKRLCSIDQV